MKDKPLFSLSNILDTLSDVEQDKVLLDYIVDYAACHPTFLARVLMNMEKEDEDCVLDKLYDYLGEEEIERLIERKGGVIV